jgi:tetratricopeptide (TPR) repeat protein
MSPDDIFERAVLLEEGGNLQEAIESWRELAAQRPTAGAFCRLGGVARDLGLLSEARDAFEQAVQLDGSCAPAYVSLALFAIEDGDQFRAEALLLESLRFDSSNEVAYCLLGTVMQSLERDSDAIRYFEKAIELNPTYEEAYFNYAVLCRESEPEKAKDLLANAVRIDPMYGAAHRELGWVLSACGAQVETERHLLKASELDPTDFWAAIYLGNHYWKVRNHDKALMWFERAILIAPEQSLPRWCLADYYASTREWDKAKQLYERALALEPDDIVAYVGYARMLHNKGDSVEAQTLLRRALLLDPEDPAAISLLVEIEQG